VCSYLLVHFWYTRIGAVKSALNAMFTNRVGDFFLTLGFFALFFTFGTLDYATIFSLAPYINTNVITFITILLVLGAAAKSAQLGLHIWLPQAMEGGSRLNFILIIAINYFLYVYILNLFSFIIKNNNFSYNNYGSINNLSVGTSKKKPLIWVYNIDNLSLIKGAPFKTKTECANVLHINRSTIAAYLDSDKLFNYKWIFSSVIISKEILSKWIIPSKVMEILIRELLGDGYIRYNPKNTPQINGRLEFTFSVKNLQYVKFLKYEALAFICNKSESTPWPNPKLRGKEPSQYWFSTKCLPIISKLHYFWYKEIKGKYIKVLPSNIEEILTPIGLAHWIMGDGYFADSTVKICTDNFTREEVLKLIEILDTRPREAGAGIIDPAPARFVRGRGLDKKFGIKSTINKRTNPNGDIKWRIRISKFSMKKLIKLVIPYFIPEMLYKLGVKK